MRYRFGAYTLDTQCYELRQDGRRVPLRPKVLYVLTYLLEHRDTVVSKDVLIAQVWPGQSISDETLSTCITAARRAVGDSGQAQQVIQTRHSHGYRFVAAVTLGDLPPADQMPLPSLPTDAWEESGQGRPPLADGMIAHATSIAALPPPPPPHPQGSLAGEQKMVTVLVCQLAPLAPLPSGTPRQAAEGQHQAMQTLCTLALEAIQGYEGTLQSVQDEGCLILFGAPVAQEDHARRAVRAALGLQQRVRSVPMDPAWPSGATYTVRLGLHTGQILLGSLGEDQRLTYTAVGDTTQHAAWLAQQAAPGTILVSDATARLVESEVRLEGCAPFPGLGPTDLRAAYQVLGLGSPRAPLLTDGARPPSRFVGRELELATLQALLARVAEGQGQVVGIVGEPGMGKTRLLAELRQRLGDTQVTVLEGQCLSYGQATPYGPLRDLLRRACGGTETDSPAIMTANVQQHLQEMGLASTEAAPLLLHLLDMPGGVAPLVGRTPQERRTQTFATLHQMLWHARQRQPLLVVVENLHWIDPTSHAFLTEVVERLGSVPLLLLVTFRPGYGPPWMQKSYATQLALPPLGPADSRRVVQAVLDPAPVPEPLMRGLLTKAAGNPLFLEELAWTVREHGRLQLPPEVPETIRAVLAARIDRLPPEAKQVLQTAAVIGTEVPVPLLQGIAAVPEATLHRSLAHLHAAEFLAETRRFPTPTWTFKHALIHEVAYSSLLQAGRRTLHARIVEAIEALAGDHVAEQVEQLAHHALRGEVWDKAVTYCQQAGARANDRAAFHEAAAAFEQALQALAHLPADRETQARAIDLRLVLVGVLGTLGAHGRRLALLGEAEAMARALDDRSRLVQVLTRMGQVYRVTADYDRAMAVGQQALKLATGLGDRTVQRSAAYFLGQTYKASSDFGRAAELLRWSVAAADYASPEPSTERIESRARLARTLGELGAFAEGRRHGEEALRLATRAGRGLTPIIAHGSLGLLYLIQGDLAHAIPVLAQGLALCRAAGARSWLQRMMARLGAAYGLQGRLVEGRALLEEGISDSRRTGELESQASWVAWLSDVCRLEGRGEEARQYAHEALALGRQRKERGGEACALYQLGVVQAHATPPDGAQAETHYRQALTLAEALGMRPLVAHCYHGLGRLYHQTGRGEQARTALATAIEMYRDMDMTFWLPQTEVTLAEVRAR